MTALAERWIQQNMSSLLGLTLFLKAPISSDNAASSSEGDEVKAGRYIHHCLSLIKFIYINFDECLKLSVLCFTNGLSATLSSLYFNLAAVYRE